MKKNEFGTLIIRIVLGLIFVIHGFSKFQEGILGTVSSRFESYDIPYPEIVAVGVTGIEFIGGLFLIIGFTTRFIASLLALIMIGAITTVKFKIGFLHGYEFDLALMAMALFLLFSGSRMLALDNFFVEKKK